MTFGRLAAVAALFLGGNAAAEIGVDAGIGSQGVSVNLQTKVLPVLVLRGGAHLLDLDIEDRELDGIDYDVDLGFNQFGGYADLHPFANGLTLTGGVLFGERSLDLVATPNEPVEVGDQTFDPEDVGELFGSADFGDQALYAGLGFDNTLYGTGRISFVLRAGVILTDNPDIRLENRGGTDDPLIQAEIDAELERERADLEAEAEDFRVFPALTVGIGLSF